LFIRRDVLSDLNGARTAKGKKTEPDHGPDHSVPVAGPGVAALAPGPA
jgi:hypothetical protein